MTQGPNKIFDDFARLMTDAAGAAQGVRKEAETAIKAQAERLMGDMDLVKRDEFEAIKEMAANARTENEVLKNQISALEERLAALEAGAKPASKTATKTTSKTGAKTGAKAAPAASRAKK